jgi:hypothetical protein
MKIWIYVQNIGFFKLIHGRHDNTRGAVPGNSTAAIKMLKNQPRTSLLQSDPLKTQEKHFILNGR